MDDDLRVLMLKLYLSGRTGVRRQVCIYTYSGVVGADANPFRLVCSDVPDNVRGSVVLQNIPAGEMMQGFVDTVNGTPAIANDAVYGNNKGVLLSVDLSSDKVAKSDKCRQFSRLAHVLLRQYRT